MRPQALETALVDADADEMLELLFPTARHVKGGLPVPEGAVAVGHALELDGGHVAAHGQGGVEDAVGGDMLLVGQRQELLADAIAVPEGEAAHAADLIRGVAALDLGLADRGMPRGVAVEVAQHRPHALDGRVDDRRAGDANHGEAGYRRNRPLSASSPTWKTPWPMDCASSPSRSGAQSNSAHHSAKVRSPSVTGVSLSVAT